MMKPIFFFICSWKPLNIPNILWNKIHAIIGIIYDFFKLNHRNVTFHLIEVTNQLKLPELLKSLNFPTTNRIIHFNIYLWIFFFVSFFILPNSQIFSRIWIVKFPGDTCFFFVYLLYSKLFCKPKWQKKNLMMGIWNILRWKQMGWVNQTTIQDQSIYIQLYV